MKKILSVFIDESGDFGFIKDASKYYLTTLVFHAGPIIRREYPFQNESIEDRKNISNSFYVYYGITNKI